MEFPKKAALTALLLLFLVYYFRVDPARYGLAPACVVYKHTGWYCFGCGGQRSLHALLNGRISEAARLNFLVFPVLFIAGIAFYSQISGNPLPRFLHRKWVKWGFLTLLLLYMLLRNIPHSGLSISP